MIVFLHGVPETAAIWSKVQSAISADSVALSLPGFGSDRPEGFGATKDDYVDWLVTELSAVDGPIDLVGHDWGAGLTFRIATAHPGLIRSWVADVGNLLHPDYVWHDFAQIWQTPGDGEAFIENQNAQPTDERAAGFEAIFALDSADAHELAAAADATMGACILDLYRSATPNVFADWGPWSPTKPKGLIMHPTDDAFADEAMAREVAGMLEADFALLPNTNHFWPYQSPQVGAEILESFWSNLS